MKYVLLSATFFSLALAATQSRCADRTNGATEIHQYTISIDATMSRLWVEARFASPVERVKARSRDARKFLLNATDCDSQRTLRIRNRRMTLPSGGVRCIHYKIDLSRASRYDPNYRGLASGNIIVSPSIWLWRPEVTARSEIRATFRLPENLRVSVPWQIVDQASNTYQLSRSPESGNALVVFGKFDYAEVKAPGTTMRVTLLDSGRTIDRPGILQWISGTATDISLAYGRFPNPSPQIVVVPVAISRSNSAVPFGRVIRNGGETVQLFVNANKPVSEYASDWTATHEFSHMMLPYLRQKHRWIAEGFAQYYQNVLLARSGVYEAQFAWQKLYDGLQRGHESRPELSPNAAAAGGIRNGLMKVYWSGAAIALMADVQLRENSGGSETLDQVLGRLQRCCLPADRMWSGIELFRKLDTLAEKPVFMPLYRRYADSSGFPDTSTLLDRLGLDVSTGKVSFRQGSELGEIRAAITHADTSTPSWRNRLTTR